MIVRISEGHRLTGPGYDRMVAMVTTDAWGHAFVDTVVKATGQLGAIPSADVTLAVDGH